MWLQLGAIIMCWFGAHTTSNVSWVQPVIGWMRSQVSKLSYRDCVSQCFVCIAVNTCVVPPLHHCCIDTYLCLYSYTTAVLSQSRLYCHDLVGMGSVKTVLSQSILYCHKPLYIVTILTVLSQSGLYFHNQVCITIVQPVYYSLICITTIQSLLPHSIQYLYHLVSSLGSECIMESVFSQSCLYWYSPVCITIIQSLLSLQNF